jgi:uncharacterized repeat protein (TIGR03803 family)
MESGLTLGFDGALYGTASLGGASGKGIVFGPSGGTVTILSATVTMGRRKSRYVRDFKVN